MVGVSVSAGAVTVTATAKGQATVTVTATAKGQATVTVTATDTEGLTATLAFTVTVPNRAPVSVGLVPAHTLTTGDAATLELSSYFSDPDGDPLVFAVLESDTAVIDVAVSGSALTVTALAKGDATATVTATDPEGLAATQAFTVTVPNRAPLVGDPIQPRTLEVGDAVVLQLSAHFSDPDADRLIYAAAASDPTVAEVEVSGATMAVTVVAKGVATVTVKATDPEGLAATQAFTVTVPNRAPLAVGVAPADTVPVGQNTTLDPSAYFRDPDGYSLVYTATASDAAVVGVSVSAGAVTVTANAKGEATVTVTASDTEGLTATQAFNVTVPNRAPVAGDAIQPRTLAVGGVAPVELSAHFSDPDGDPLDFAAVTSNSTVARVEVSDAALTVTAIAKGEAAVTVTASDGDGPAATRAFTVTVSNQAPLATGTFEAWTLTAGETGTLELSPHFGEPDGDALTFAATAKGVATVTITATDTEGLSAAQAFTVTVPNRTPLVVGTFEALRLTSGGVARVDPAPGFADPDGDSLIFEATSSDLDVARAWVSLGQVLVRAVGKGTATVTVVGRDSEGLRARQEFNVRVQGPKVSNPNEAPFAVGALVDQNLEVGDTRTLTVASYFADPDEDDLLFAAESSNDSVAAAAARGSEVVLRAVAEGTTSITIAARDPDGLSASLGFLLTVSEATEANRAPVVIGTAPDQTLDEGDAVKLNASYYFLDPDNDVLTFTAAVLDASVATATVSGTEVVIQALAPGVTLGTITARDPGGLAAAQDFTVTVADSSAPPANVVPCRNGFAGEFPCSGVDLVSLLTLDQIGASGAITNDIWGWTDPVTGTEWALVGRSTGTSFINLRDPARPLYTGFLPTSGSGASVWRDIKVYGNHAFIVADQAGPHGMQVFDLTQLRNVQDPPQTFAATTTYQQDRCCPQHRDQRRDRLRLLGGWTWGCGHMRRRPPYDRHQDALESAIRGLLRRRIHWIGWHRVHARCDVRRLQRAGHRAPGEGGVFRLQ